MPDRMPERISEYMPMTSRWYVRNYDMSETMICQNNGSGWGSLEENIFFVLETCSLLLLDWTGVGKCPNWTSPNYWGYNHQQILGSDVQNPQNRTFTNPCWILTHFPTRFFTEHLVVPFTFAKKAWGRWLVSWKHRKIYNATVSFYILWIIYIIYILYLVYIYI